MKNNNCIKTTLMKNIKASTDVDLVRQKLASYDLLEIAVQDNDSYALAFAHSYLADYYIMTRNHAKGAEHLHLSLTISEDNQYRDLMMLNYTISGLYFSAHFDEVTAIQYFLNGLHIAQEIEDLYEEMIILNHISSLFQQKEDFEEALQYSIRAFHIFLKMAKQVEKHAELAVILSLIQLYLQNHNPKEATATFDTYIPSIKRYMIDKQATDGIRFCELMLAEAAGQVDQVFAIADAFSQRDLQQEVNRSMYFSFYRDILDILLHTKDKKRAEQFLQLMGEICLNNDIEQQLQLHLSWINFAETFHLEDTLINSYKQYYLLQKMVSDITNKTKADSMKEKILINRMLEERETIVKEKNVLATKVKIDELTHLFNRSYFNTLVNAMHVNKDVHFLGFILIDVDCFKEYNDFYGHYQGDKLLQKIAASLDENCDSRYFAARYGGDEFICLCVNVTEREMEDYLTHVYQQLASQHIEHQTSSVSDIATISSGYALFANDENFSCDVGVTLADAALYKAKQQGKKQFAKY